MKYLDIPSISKCQEYNIVPLLIALTRLLIIRRPTSQSFLALCKNPNYLLYVLWITNTHNINWNNRKGIYYCPRSLSTHVIAYNHIHRSRFSALQADIGLNYSFVGMPPVDIALQALFSESKMDYSMLNKAERAHIQRLIDCINCSSVIHLTKLRLFAMAQCFQDSA